MEQAPITFKFPKSHAYPPMWDIQRVLATRETQFKRWSGLILAYCRYYGIWRLRLIEMLDSPLFNNKSLRKWLTLPEIREIVDWMTTDEGQKRAEWVSDTYDKTVAWIYWRRPEEWAEFMASWVENTGQKNTVFTLYELAQGEATAQQEFHGIDPDVLRKALTVLVKRSKAQLFGSQDEQGVKFF